MLELPEIIIGERHDIGALWPLEREGFNKDDIRKLVLLTQSACKQILFGLPKKAGSLLPLCIPLYYYRESEKTKHHVGAAHVGFEELPVCDEAKFVYCTDFDGIGIRYSPEDLVTRERKVREVIIHEILHATYPRVQDSSRSVCETINFALQRSCGVQYYYGKEIEDAWVLQHDQEVGLRTDDYARFETTKEFDDILYTYASQSAKCLSNSTVADVCTELEVKARSNLQRVSFQELSDAFSQTGTQGKALINTIPFKKLQSGSHSFTTLNPDRTEAGVSQFLVQKNWSYLPKLGNASGPQFVIKNLSLKNQQIVCTFDFGYFGSLTNAFDLKVAEVGKNLLLSRFLIDALLRNVTTETFVNAHGEEFGVSDLVRIICEFEDGHKFELKPDLSS